MSQDLQPFNYSAPSIVNTLRPYLNFPRFQYSSDFPKFLDVESDEHEKYKEGLIAIGVAIGIIFFLWGSIILILRCNGKSAGCGAGFPFKSKKQEIYNVEHHSEAANPPASSAVEDSRSNRKLQSNSPYDLDSIGSSTESCDAAEEMADEVESYSNDVVEFSTLSKCEQRTQLFFWIFSAATIVSALLIVLLVILPLKNTTEQLTPEVLYAREIITEMNVSLETITASLDVSSSITRRVPENFTSLCPLENFENVTFRGETIPEDNQAWLESANDNLWRMHRAMKYDARRIHHIIRIQLAGIENFYTKLDAIFDYAEAMSEDSKAYLLAITILLIVTVVATGILSVGVYMSRIREASQNFQMALSYGVLPVLFIATVIAWIIAVGAAVTTVVGDDACNTGSSEGSPHATFMEVLDTFDFNSSYPLYAIVSAYTGECENGVDPVQDLELVEEDIQAAIGVMWKTLGEISKIGAIKVSSACGGQEEELDAFKSAFADLAQTLTIIQSSVGSLTGTMKCDRVYPLYVESVEKTACNEMASAVAWSIITFFMLGVSTMGMITLRSAWRHEIEGDEIYGEDEEIENMFVDEHEEYLAYISKYKHEWEDSEGRESDLRPNNRVATSRTMNPIHPSASAKLMTSRTHSSDSGSEKEAELDGEYFEDEHLAIRSGMLKPSSAREDLLAATESVAFSPTSTVASGEFSFASSASLLGRSPDNSNSGSDIKVQRSKELDLIRRISRRIAGKSNRKDNKLIEKVTARFHRGGSLVEDVEDDKDQSIISSQMSTTESEDDSCAKGRNGRFLILPDSSYDLSSIGGHSETDDILIPSSRLTEFSLVPIKKNRGARERVDPVPINTALSSDANHPVAVIPQTLFQSDSDEAPPPPLNSFDIQSHERDKTIPTSSSV